MNFKEWSVFDVEGRGEEERGKESKVLGR